MPIPRLNLLIPRKNWVLILVVLGLLGLTLFEWEDWRGENRQEEKVALAQVPAPVKATIDQEAKAGALKEIERTTVDGKSTSVAGIVINGKEQESRLGEDGKVISRGARQRDDED